MRIGFLNICHEDYQDDLVFTVADRAVKRLHEHGVELVLPEKTVCNWDAAKNAGISFASSNLDGVILFLGSWMECSVALAAIREIEHLPMCLWGFPMFEWDGKLESTGSYVSFSMFSGTMRRAGYLFSSVIGMPDDDATVRAVIDFCAASAAKASLRRSRVGLVGYTSMCILPGTFDHLLMRTLIGPEIVQSDSYTLIHKALHADRVAVESAITLIRRSGRVCEDVRPEELEKAAGIYCALKETVGESGLDAINIKCQYEFSKEYKMVPCVPLSVLADNGTVAGCEGDIPCTVSQLILHYLTGQVVTYGDSINHAGNAVKFSSCGMLPPSLGCGDKMIRRFLPHPGFNGLQMSFVMRPERVTFLRLVEDVGTFHFLYGAGTGLPTELRQGYMPALDVELDGNVNELVQNYAGQHFALCYGDVTSRIDSLARVLHINGVRI